MSTTNPQRDNTTGRPAPSVEDIRHLSQVGTDAKGCEHYYCQVRRTLYVLDGDAVAHAEAIRDRPLDDWVDFVEERVGWETLYYSRRPLLDRLAELFG